MRTEGLDFRVQRFGGSVCRSAYEVVEHLIFLFSDCVAGCFDLTQWAVGNLLIPLVYFFSCLIPVNAFVAEDGAEVVDKIVSLLDFRIQVEE